MREQRRDHARVGSRQASSAPCRCYVDVFTDLTELQTQIGRNPSERPAPREHESRYRSHQLPQSETTLAVKGNDSVLEN